MNSENYSCILGGLAIRFSIAISCRNKEVELDMPFREKDFTCNSYDIQMSFACTMENLWPHGDILLSNKKSILCKNKRDFQLFYFLDDEKKNIDWLIKFDNTFSRFHLSFKDSVSLWGNCSSFFFDRFLFQHTFINHHGLIIHAAGGSINGKGMVFPAVSGTGKSTLSHLLLPFSENQLFSEERIIMRRLDDGWHLWGTPWKGTGSIARNESAPLSTSAALRRLLETVSIPWYSQEWTDKGLAVCESLLRDIPAFELAFRPDETAVQAVADFAASLP